MKFQAQMVEMSQQPHSVHVEVPVAHHKYLDHVMRSKAVIDIMGAFSGAHSPAKELTESYSALHHLRPFIANFNEYLGRWPRVLHVGDGRMCRTGVMFAFYSGCDNLSVDPDVNRAGMGRWMSSVNAQRIACLDARVEDVLDKVNAFEPDMMTFVHSHVNPDWLMLRVPSVRQAFIMPCCHPGMQFSCANRHRHVDWGVLSPMRTIQVVDLTTGTADRRSMQQNADRWPSSKG